MLIKRKGKRIMKILVSAESFGYGPITTGLNIVKELKKYNDVKLESVRS